MSNIKTLRALKKALLRAKHEDQVVSLLDENSTLLDEAGRAEVSGWAVDHNRPHVVKALVQRGVDIEAARAGGLTALQWAVEWGYEGMARVLLEQGADITNKGSYGNTPLHLALRSHRDTKLVKLLLEHMGGQGLEERDGDNSTALATAAAHGHVEAVSLLLDQGADPRVRVLRHRTPLMLAAQRGDDKGLGVVKLLLQHLQTQDIDARDTEGQTALHLSCTPTVDHKSCEGIVKVLLLAGANPTITDIYGTNPRLLAQWQSPPCVLHKLAAVFKWWEREPERRFLLHKARCLSNVCSPVTCLEARVGAGQDLPCVEVMSKERGNGKRKRLSREEQGQEEERHAAVEYVVEGLSEELFTELMQGLYLDHTY